MHHVLLVDSARHAHRCGCARLPVRAWKVLATGEVERWDDVPAIQRRVIYEHHVVCIDRDGATDLMVMLN